ncbi:metallophosphoesterase [Romeria aff. gracilis LEGE 07310]|uniref:Metallophosphoesterase n=1 Tax=Vasconcelosia minhoensis LEGE 07310 TaxID=915328 RepID=A0A8J7AVR7_9CYAN|nr:metallophosphoesterase [Romeria gracilis]MBE9076572.1 metallophosphoesterase [Romeria aff. gracilis LEGE 07310]
MKLDFRFAVISDLHIALPHTIWDSPSRFHLVEVSIPAFEQILEQLEQLELDFLLLPGDLVQHGERENHQWLADRLAKLPFPTYVVPGNHDVITRQGCDRTLPLADFPRLYQSFGYSNPEQLYYRQEILPNVHLIGLNTNAFDAEGQPFNSGYIDAEQLAWLDAQLAELADRPERFVMVMLHHNAIEHLPGQAKSAMGQRYMVRNAGALTERLKAAGVPLMFTGHLHVQDIARCGSLYEITTGSLVSYPHPYRLLHLWTDSQGQKQLQIESTRVEAVPDWPALQTTSQTWMSDRAFPFMVKLLTDPPLCLAPSEAKAYAPQLKDFWANVAAGDAVFDYPHLPQPLQRYFHRFSAVDADGMPQAIDNNAVLAL